MSRGFSIQRISPMQAFAIHRVVACSRRALATLVCVALVSGCASTDWVSLREAPRTPLVERLNLLARGGPKPTERTVQFLRRYDLLQSLDDEPRELLGKIQYVLERDPSPDGCHAFAELAYIAAIKRQNDANPRLALPGAQPVACGTR